MMGSSKYGKLGLQEVVGLADSSSTKIKPSLVGTLAHFEIDSISLGAEHTVAVTADGDVYSWG